MNLELLRKKGYIIYECISGSHAYGTNIKGSDTDIRGIFVLPTEEVLAGRYIEQVSDEKNDITFFEIGRFIELLAKGNPNIQELLNVPEDCIVYKDPYFDSIFTDAVKKRFITKKLKHTFTGFAFAQIKKAKGLNKKMNWDENRVTRKGPLDFCYVITHREQSEKFNHWIKEENQKDLSRYYEYPNIIGGGLLNKDNIALAKVNNAPDLYSMYYYPEGKGLVGGDSNQVRLENIPKEVPWIGYLRFDQNAYSQHCKDYKSYQDWLENRNEERHKSNKKGEQGYDHKNMMHCYRLLYMAQDIAEGRGIVVRRPERDFLLDIRNGKKKYETILEDAEKLVEQIENSFDNADLPKGVSPSFVQRLIQDIRLNNFGGHDVTLKPLTRKDA